MCFELSGVRSSGRVPCEAEVGQARLDYVVRLRSEKVAVSVDHGSPAWSTLHEAAELLSHRHLNWLEARFDLSPVRLKERRKGQLLTQAVRVFIGRKAGPIRGNLKENAI